MNMNFVIDILIAHFFCVSETKDSSD